MKKLIYLLLIPVLFIACSEQKAVKQIPLTSDSPEAIALMREYIKNWEERKWYFNRGIKDSILNLDPNFAVALAWFDNFQDRDSRREMISKAYELRNQVSPIESMFIEASYERIMNSNVKAADSIFSKMLIDFPDYYKLYEFAGDIKNNLNEPEKSEKLWEKQLELNPDSFSAYENLAFLHFPTGNDFTMLPESKRDLDKAAKLLNDLQDKFPSSQIPSRFLGNIYRAKNDFDMAEKSYQNALSIMDKTFDMDDKDQANAYGNSLLMMGHINTFQEKYDEARDYYQKAINVSIPWWKVQISVLNSHTYLYEKDYSNAVFVLSDIYEQVSTFDEIDEIAKNNMRFFIEFSKFLAFGHSLNEEETLKSMENMSILRSKNMRMMRDNASSDTEIDRLNIGEERNKLDFEIWQNILFGRYEIANQLLEDFKALSSKASSWNPNAMNEYYSLKGYNSLMEGNPELSLENYNQLPPAVIDNDSYHKYFKALALKATGKDKESQEIMIVLANDNFATWQNSIVKNLAKAQIKTNL